MKRIIVTGMAFLLFSCSNNGGKSSSPDPKIDTTMAGDNDSSGKDINAQGNGGRMGDSTGTRSPHLKDSSRH